MADADRRLVGSDGKSSSLVHPGKGGPALESDPADSVYATWRSIETAPRNGSSVVCRWGHEIVSTCVWIEDTWWDTRAEEVVTPLEWLDGVLIKEGS